MKGMGEELTRLAGLFGLEEEYTDNWGRVHRAGAEAARLILQAKGIRVESALLDQDSGPLVAAVDSLPEHWSFHLDSLPSPPEGATQPRSVRVRIISEDGTERELSPSDEEVSLLPGEGSAKTGLTVPFPRDLPVGVYRARAQAHVTGAPVSSEAQWLVCPTRAYLPPRIQSGGRIAGVAIALYGVRSNRNWGVGDFSDLERIIDWAADDLGVDMVGLNPLHAIFNRRPYNVSPYLPSSRIFRNFIYIDVERIPDFRECTAARELMEQPEMAHRLEDLRSAEHVRYEEVAALKLKVLREVFLSFSRTHGRRGSEDARWKEFLDYIESMGDYLLDFATFCALDEAVRAEDPTAYSWRDWPVEFRDPRGQGVAQFRENNRESVLFWMYLQWQLETQMAAVQQYAKSKGMLVGLYHDQAVGVDRDGADFWALRDYYHEDFSVGAPPDPFAPDGQDWGFPPPHRDRMRDAAYEPLRRMLQANCRFGGALRIDHIMQVHRLFWIPKGKSPADGVYVRDYEEDLLNIIGLESARHSTIIVGEDLGTVPFHLRERLMAKGIFSYRLFYFERDGGGKLLPPHSYPENALVSITTHDLPTLAGFWSGRDISLRRDAGQLDEEGEKRFREDRGLHKSNMLERLVQEGLLSEEASHQAWHSGRLTHELQSAVLRFLFKTPCKLALVNQEDIFCDERQQNLPGTTSEHPNWVTKMAYSVEELRTHPEAVRLSRNFRRLLDEAGRTMQ